MPRRSRTGNGPNKPLAIFATFLVVVGVAAVVVMSSQFAKLDQAPRAAVSSTTSTVSNHDTSASGTAVLVNPLGVTLVHLGGSTERLTFDQFETRVPLAQQPYEGSSVANGAPVYFRAAPQATSTDVGIPSPDKRYVAKFDTPKSDGATVLELIRSTEKPRTFTLRTAAGQPLRDAYLLGWFDASRIAIAAIATSSRAVYSVSLQGASSHLVDLPDTTVAVNARAGAVWYLTAVIGEGIESSPTGPSEVHRVTIDGIDRFVARNERRVIVSVIPDAFHSSSTQRVALTMDDGQSCLLQEIGRSPSSCPSIGKLRPLFFLPDGRLLVRDGFEIHQFDPTSQTSVKLGDLPEGTVDLFFIP